MSMMSRMQDQSPSIRAEINGRMRHANLELFSLGLMIFISVLFFDTYARYAIYTFPIITLIRWSIDRTRADSRNFLLLMLYLTAFSISAFYSQTITQRGVENAVFIIVPILSMLPWLPRSEKSIIYIAALAAAAQLLNVALVASKGELIFSLQDSESSFESYLSFFFGAVAVFFAVRKSYILTLCFSLLTVVGSKRIALLAMVVSMLFSFITGRRLFKNGFSPVIGFVIFIVIGIYAINIVPIAEALIRFFDINMSVNQFTQGRAKLSYALIGDLYNKPTTELFFGSGAGFADNIAFETSNGALNLPHNDYLKMLSDYGIVGFILILGGLSFSLCRSKAGSCMLLYLSILFISDNVIVYTPIMLIIFLLADVDLQIASKVGERMAMSSRDNEGTVTIKRSL